MRDYFIIFFLFTIFGFGQFDYHLKSHQITLNTKCFFGLHGEATEINGGNVINTCYIKTDEGYVVIDSGPTYYYAQQAYKIMQKEYSLPIKYLINTSSNELNILGNEFYKERGATLIGPQSYNKKPLNRSISLKNRISKSAFDNTRLITLDILLNKDKTLHLDKISIEIKKLESKEAQNLLVHLPKEKIVFVGNFISDNPSLIRKEHYSGKEWAKNFHRIENLSWRHIISSHGVKRDRKALVTTRDYLKLFQQKIKKERPKVVAAKQKNDTKKNDTKKIVKTTELKVKKIVKKKDIPCIQYTNLKRAKQLALKEHKYVMIKIEADNCSPCKKLNRLMQTNNKIKKMVNKYIKAVKINRDHEAIPDNYDIIVAPTILLLNPKTNQILVQLEGTETFEDLYDAFKMFVTDSITMKLASL